MAGPAGWAAKIYDSGTVAAGAVIASGALSVSQFSTLLIVAKNEDGGTRALTMDVLLDDASTVLKNDLAVRTVAATSEELIVIGNSAIATTVAAVVAMPLPTHVSFSIAAAGTSNARLTIFGR